MARDSLGARMRPAWISVIRVSGSGLEAGSEAESDVCFDICSVAEAFFTVGFCCLRYCQI